MPLHPFHYENVFAKKLKCEGFFNLLKKLKCDTEEKEVNKNCIQSCKRILSSQNSRRDITL